MTGRIVVKDLPDPDFSGAACLGKTDVMFPICEEVKGTDTLGTRQARIVCSHCPSAVLQICLRYAVLTRQEAGIWGGMRTDERFNLRRRWRKAGILDILERDGVYADLPPTPPRRKSGRPRKDAAVVQE